MHDRFLQIPIYSFMINFCYIGMDLEHNSYGKHDEK